MKRKVLITSLILISLLTSLICLSVFLPHLQRTIRYSGGVLELEFEDGSKQYVANGGKIQVEVGCECIVRVVTSTNAHFLYRHNATIIEENQKIVFDEPKLYYFDLYESGGNYVSIYIVEAV